MSDHIYTLEQLKALIQPLLIEYHAESAILFGSYARGEATEQSDIDLIVVGERISALQVFWDLEMSYMNAAKKCSCV